VRFTQGCLYTPQGMIIGAITDDFEPRPFLSHFFLPSETKCPGRRLVGAALQAESVGGWQSLADVRRLGAGACVMQAPSSGQGVESNP
jgi:hypothetical protein